jgi:hypothetical protein
MLRRRAGLPDAEKPDPVESHLGKPVEFGVRNIIQRGGATKGFGEFGQPDTRVDLIKRRIFERDHVQEIKIFKRPDPNVKAGSKAHGQLSKAP